jgi:hypothetical protein
MWFALLARAFIKEKDEARKVAKLTTLLNAFERRITNDVIRSKDFVHTRDSVDSTLALESAFINDDHEAMLTLLHDGGDGSLASKINIITNFVSRVHEDVDSKISPEDITDVVRLTQLSAAVSKVNLKIDSLSDQLQRLAYGINSNANVVISESLTYGHQLRMVSRLEERIEGRVVFSVPWLVPRKIQNLIRAAYDTTTVSVLPEVRLGFTNAYTQDMWTVLFSGQRTVEYLDGSSVKVGQTDLVHDYINAISSPDDDATDVEVNPWSQVKGLARIIDMMAAAALAYYKVPTTSIGGITIGEDEIKQFVKAAVSTVTSGTNFTKREHATDVNTGSLSITETSLGALPGVGSPLVTIHHPPGS